MRATPAVRAHPANVITALREGDFGEKAGS